MKFPRLLPAVFLGISFAAAAFAVAPKPAPRADVVFVEPEKFTDVRDSASDTNNERGRDKLDEIRDYLVTQSRIFVPEGQHLTITITDVDLAGDFEPWHGSRWDDVRIVKEIYPPRIDLSFQLTDAAGNILKQGKRELRDLAFMMKLTMSFRDDPLRHEKALLDDWLRDEFPQPKHR